MNVVVVVVDVVVVVVVDDDDVVVVVVVDDDDCIDLPSLQEVTYMNETFAKCNQVTFESKHYLFLFYLLLSLHTSFSFCDFRPS